jgi:hypothetical protein
MWKNLGKSIVKPLLGALLTTELNKMRIEQHDAQALRESGFSEEDIQKFALGLKVAGGSVFMRLFDKL